MLPKFSTFLLMGMANAVAALSETPKKVADAPTTRRLIIGSPAQILTASFDGSKFAITGNSTTAGSAPSWLLPKNATSFYAVNENANDVSLFSLDASGNPTLTSSANGIPGVVFLEFNEDKTRMVSAGYGSGAVEVWDSSAPDGHLKPVDHFNVTGTLGPKQTAHHPHQALLDPSGRYFVIPDLGGDQILVLDSKADAWKVTKQVPVDAGVGPRHGGFIKDGDKTYYVLACETGNVVYTFSLTYTDSSIDFKQIQKQSTYGTSPPASATSAAAGELIVANNNRDVYIWLSGNETDSIAHFVFENNTLSYEAAISSGGILPRMFSLSKDQDQELVFVANQGGDSGLVALKRCHLTGTLEPEPVATLANNLLAAPIFAGTPNVGPQFVLEI